jgi:large subunit ribosomal protein L21
MAKESYAIVEIAGKQYKVTPGDTVNVNFLDAVPDKVINFDKVLLVVDGDQRIIGTPAVDKASVTATCISEGKDKKIIVFHYKAKVRERKKKGHRQLFTKLQINNIIKPDGKKISPKTKEKVLSGGIS